MTQGNGEAIAERKMAFKEEHAKTVALDRSRRIDILENQQKHKMALEKARSESVILQLQQKKLAAHEKLRDKKMAVLLQVYTRHSKVTESPTATETQKADSAIALYDLEQQMNEVEFELAKTWEIANK